MRWNVKRQKVLMLASNGHSQYVNGEKESTVKIWEICMQN